MKFKQMVWKIAVPIIVAATISACGGTSGGSSKKITLWASGSDNVRVMFEKQVENFNKTNKEGYQVKLEFITSGTGTQSLSDRVIAAKKAGQKKTNFDLIEFNGDEVLKYIQEGGEDIFIPIDKSKIPNISKLKFPATFRDDLVVPYRGTTVVLAYNSETVPEPPKTTEELYKWIKEHPGRFAYNTPGSGGAGGSFVTTSIYNFLPEEAMTSTDPKWKDQWKQGFDLLKELHPYMYKSGGKVVYPNKNQGSIDLLANKEVDMIPAWADMIISQVRQGAIPSSIKISQLQPAFTGSTVALAIPSIGGNSEGAYAFINYMLSPEAQNIELDIMAAIPVIDFSELNPELTKTISSLKIDKFRIISNGSLNKELNAKWDEEIGTLK
jgi:putative spermidine/putrescine transport system substrate-binding protein